MKVITFMFCILSVSNNILAQNYFYSFENTFSGWDTTGIDLQLADTIIAWSIHPSDECAIDSSYSMQYYLENYNDAGKIWVQKPFIVEQQKDYIINIDYKFATRDFGMANLWTIITGVHLEPPDSANDLQFQGHTGNGFDFDTGYVWLDKNYEFNINTDTNNSIWIVIGIWGNWETPRTYYVDSLSIRIREENPNVIPNDIENISYYLFQNYPNPFNPSTKIEFTIPSVTLRQAQSDSWVTLKVYGILGNEIATLVNEEKQPGTYEVEFNPTSRIKNLASGIYFYQLKTDNYIETKKMVLLR